MLKELPKTLSSNADSVIDELMKEEDSKREKKPKEEINYDQLIKSNPMTPEPTKFASISTAVGNK